MAKSTTTTTTTIKPPEGLEAKLAQLVGNIVEPAPASTVAPAFRAPAPEELRAFPPPPPLDAGLKPPVFPQAPPGMVFGDRSTHAGLTVGHMTPNPVVDSPVEPPPPPPPAFEQLSKKTRAELHAAYLLKHNTLDGFEYNDRSDAHVPSSNITVDPTTVEPEPTVDMSKLSEKTRKELAFGAARLGRRSADYRAVVDQVAANEAKKLAEANPQG